MSKGICHETYQSYLNIISNITIFRFLSQFQERSCIFAYFEGLIANAMALIFHWLCIVYLYLCFLWMVDSMIGLGSGRTLWPGRQRPGPEQTLCSLMHLHLPLVFSSRFCPISFDLKAAKCFKAYFALNNPSNLLKPSFPIFCQFLEPISSNHYLLLWIQLNGSF